MIEKKIKCWVLYEDEYPGGVIYKDRGDAMELSREIREDYGLKAYVRVKYFINEQLESFLETD